MGASYSPSLKGRVVDLHWAGLPMTWQAYAWGEPARPMLMAQAKMPKAGVPRREVAEGKNGE